MTIAAYMPDEAAEIMFSHCGELYLSWLDSLSGIADHNKNPKYRIVYINCPVDIEIYGNSHTLVGQIVDDSIVGIENGVGVLIDENNQKIVVLPSGEKYPVHLTATDDGEVTYTVAERSIESGYVEKVVSYYQVSVYPGDELSGTVENWKTVFSAMYPLHVNDANDSLEPSVNQGGNSEPVFTTVERRLAGLFPAILHRFPLQSVRIAAENLLVWREKSSSIQHPPVMNTDSQ